jgi:hypothetical protein
MNLTSKLLKDGRLDDIWTKHCGFINLSIDEFMEIQERLLAEQIELLAASSLGSELMHAAHPANTDEFRSQIPLTTYENYAPYLDEQNEKVLPVKVHKWARTSGRTSEKGPKWVPITKTMYDLLGDSVIGVMILSSCTAKGDVQLELNDKLLLTIPPPPYISGFGAYAARDQMDVRFLPSLEEGESMDFGQRVAAGFNLAMREGLDYFYGVASVLVRMGEQFENSSGGTKPSLQMLNPVVLWRLLKAVYKTRVQNRKLLPKDIWKLKGITTGGTDTVIYKNKIEYYWGRKPLEAYGCTEGGGLACQAWNYKGMYFYPDRNFLEFIPLDEYQKNLEDPSYNPKTCLMNELVTGIYELVITNFHGGVFLRYRLGDLLEVISVGDAEIGSELPQFRYYSRNKDVIDLASLVRLTEKEIWRGIESTGIGYKDWVVCKEFHQDKPFLHVYIEPLPGQNNSLDEVREKIRQYLLENNNEYQDTEEILGTDPLVVSFLTIGAFEAYMEAQQAAGADMAHIKPAHMQPSQAVMARLVGTPSETENPVV